MRQLERLWKHQKDSLAKSLNVPKSDSERLKQGQSTLQIINNKEPVKSNSIDQIKTIGEEQLSKIDEVEQAKEVKKEVEEYTGEIKGYTGDISQLPDSLKSLKSDLTNGENLTNRLEEEAIKHTDLGGISSQQKEFEALKDTPKEYTAKADKYKAQMDKLQDHKAMQDQLKKKATLRATELFKKHGDKLEGAQTQLSKLKRKYSTVLNSNDLSTAVKRKSLKGEPFKKRLYLSGNFQIISTDPVSLDASPLLGYRFDKKLIAGISGTYRKTFGSYPSGVRTSENMAGYGSFVSYDLVKSFFAYGEAERMNVQVKEPLTDLKHREWISGIHAGVGREFNFSKLLKSQVLFLYNFSHKRNKELYPRKFMVKVGFSVK